jgi:hypothetical protein
MVYVTWIRLCSIFHSMTTATAQFLSSFFFTQNRHSVCALLILQSSKFFVTFFKFLSFTLTRLAEIQSLNMPSDLIGNLSWFYWRRTDVCIQHSILTKHGAVLFSSVGDLISSKSASKLITQSYHEQEELKASGIECIQRCILLFSITTWWFAIVGAWIDSRARLLAVAFRYFPAVPHDNTMLRGQHVFISPCRHRFPCTVSLNSLKLFLKK